MRQLFAFAVYDLGFGGELTQLALYNSSADRYRLASRNVLAEAHAHLRGKAKRSTGRHGLGHRFIQKSTHDAAMDDAAETFELCERSPLRHLVAIIVRRANVLQNKLALMRLCRGISRSL